ncbi:GspMb/PilO family protein [Gemmatimonas sp.]
MSRVPISARDARALWFGGLIVVVALTLTWVVRPSLDRRELAADQLTAEQALLDRERAALAATGSSGTAADLQDSVAAQIAARAFSGTDAPIASAAFAEYVSAAARENDIWLQLTATRAPVAGRAGVQILRTELRGEGDVGGLLRFLRVLEVGPKLVRIEQLDVSGAPTGTDDGTAPLAISATVVGFGVLTEPVSRLQANSVRMSAISSSAATEIDRLVERDLFSAERRAPTEPFRIASRHSAPSAEDVSSALSDADDGAGELPTILGTAVDASGSGFAMATLSGGPVVVIRVGDVLGPYRVLTIERARVQFRNAAGQRYTVDATASPDGAVP